jgi:gamma-glutamylcyclotransferase (GGCT)/AIG2-like uncharacterized protein YtfP
MTQALNPHIFVYGSLMSNSGYPMGERLAREAERLGEATIQGRLYAISWYPGVVESETAGEQAHGEVYRLNDAAAALAWLDEYEGSAPAGPNEYERVERPVKLTDGRTILAWVYLYRASVAKAARIDSGRWTGKAS